MAKATKKIIKTTIVNLELTEREASLIRSLMLRVGGSPKGPRGEIDRIFIQLSELTLDDRGDAFSTSGGIVIEKA